MFRRYFILIAAATLVAGTVARADDDWTDVTSQVKALIKNNTLIVMATNDNFGDPASGTTKKLRVEYTIDKSAGVRTAEENQRLSIVAANGKTLTIQKATYGDLEDRADKVADGDIGLAAGTADVTQKLKDAVKNNKLEIKANNDSLGDDPAVGDSKRLTVDYSVGGTAHKAIVDEEKTLTLPAAGDGSGELAIVLGVWGVASR